LNKKGIEEIIGEENCATLYSTEINQEKSPIENHLVDWNLETKKKEKI